MKKRKRSYDEPTYYKRKKGNVGSSLLFPSSCPGHTFPFISWIMPGSLCCVSVDEFAFLCFMSLIDSTTCSIEDRSIKSSKPSRKQRTHFYKRHKLPPALLRDEHTAGIIIQKFFGLVITCISQRKKRTEMHARDKNFMMICRWPCEGFIDRSAYLWESLIFPSL